MKTKKQRVEKTSQPSQRLELLPEQFSQNFDSRFHQFAFLLNGSGGVALFQPLDLLSLDCRKTRWRQNQTSLSDKPHSSGHRILLPCLLPSRTLFHRVRDHQTDPDAVVRFGSTVAPPPSATFSNADRTSRERARSNRLSR